MSKLRRFIAAYPECELEKTAVIALGTSSEQQAPECHNTVCITGRSAPLARGAAQAEAHEQAVRFNPHLDALRMEALAVLLEDVSAEVAPIEHAQGSTTMEIQDWDDHTLVEVALFLQPAW